MACNNKRILWVICLAMFAFSLSAQTMEWIHLPGKYVDIKYLGNDMFKVKGANNKWGILSYEGKLVVDTEQDSITSFVENRALILQGKENRIMRIINSEGETVKNFNDKKIYATNYPYFKEGLLSYKEESGLYGYINTHGKISINAKFDFAAPFQEGIATVRYPNNFYGLIDKSGGNAIIDDKEFFFLSSLVDGHLLALTTYRKGGYLLRIMQLKGNKLVKTKHKQLESKLFMNLSDDASYLSCQNGHHYFIDNQWRISGANYQMELPYELKKEVPFVIESSELLSKQYIQNGYQITYKGNPIMEQTFLEVIPFEKRYAIVKGKDKEYGILKLNSAANIEFKTLAAPVVFRHNPFPMYKGKDKFVISKSALKGKKSSNSNEKYLEDLDLSRYIGLDVGLTNVDISRIKCYINDNGHLYYAPIREQEGRCKIYLPYFREDSLFNNEMKEEIDIAMTYDGLDWMHKKMSITSKHEEGCIVTIHKNPLNIDGTCKLDFVIQTIGDYFKAPIKFSIPTLNKEFVYTGGENKLTITERVPQGVSKTFNYVIHISEEGCPVKTQHLSVSVNHPIINLD